MEIVCKKDKKNDIKTHNRSNSISQIETVYLVNIVIESERQVLEELWCKRDRMRGKKYQNNQRHFFGHTQKYDPLKFHKGVCVCLPAI